MAVKGPRVDLSRAEVVNAAMTGVLRRVNGIFGAAQTVPGIDADGKGWAFDIESACSERTFAKALNVYWDSSLGRYRNSEEGDVGAIEIRWTAHQHGHLPLRPEKDKPDAYYVLVVGLAPHYRVVGWIYGTEGMVDAHWADPGDRGEPCWWVPQWALHEMTELPR